MINLMLMAHNEREEQILKMALEQRGIKIISSKATYQNYILTLQYLPDLILIEVPRISGEQMHFTGLIRKHKRSHAIPIVGYGDCVDNMVKRGMAQMGVNFYLERPLKFTALIGLIEQVLKQANKKVELKAQVGDKEKDIELILSSSALPMQKIEAMTRHVSLLMAFPFTVAKVLQISQDAKSGADHLSHAIQADPAITTHLLKVSNSVFFASANRRITSIKDAIVRIGFTETKKIVMSMSIMKLFETQNKNNGFDRIDFWYHSLSTAIIAEHVAKYMGNISTEVAFLAGLLHDLGIIILDEFFSGIFDKILEFNTQQGGQFIESEIAFIGISHNDMIAGLFPSWKIPQDITEGITDQYKVQEFEENFETTGKKIALCVSIGNTVSKVLYLGRECDEYVKPITNVMLQQAHLATGIGPNFVETVYKDIELFHKFLQLEKREYPREHSGLLDAASISVAVINQCESAFVMPYNCLKKQGMNVDLYGSVASSDTDNKYDMIIVWANSIITPEQVEQYSHIVKRTIDPPKVDTIQMAPLLLILPIDAAIVNGCPKHISYIYNSMDLRYLEKTIAEILMSIVVCQALPQKAESIKPHQVAEGPPPVGIIESDIANQEAGTNEIN